MTEDTRKRDAEVVRDLAAAIASPVSSGSGRKYLLVPEGFEVQDLGNFDPTMVIVNRSFSRLESLLDYVKNNNPEGSVCYAKERSDQLNLSVVLDPTTDSARSPESHTAACTILFHTDFSDWSRADKGFMSQSDFADFVDDHFDCFISPDGAAMLEIAQTLKIHRKVNWSNHVSLSNNAVNFAFEETDDAKVGKKGQLKLPETFQIALPIFHGSNVRYEINARLRYRLNNGQLAIGFKLNRPDRVVETATDEIVAKIREAGITTYYGSTDPIDN